MSYNLESLINILEQILHPVHQGYFLDPKKKLEFDFFLEISQYLTEFCGNYPASLSRDKIDSLESRIRDATHEAEDIIESYLVDQTLCSGFIISPQGLEKVFRDFVSIKIEIEKMMTDDYLERHRRPPKRLKRSDDDYSSPSHAFDPNPKSILVGISQDSIQLKDRLTGQQSDLQVIPIVGMGGIGKTTLARNVYDDPLITYHFDSRAWVTISQDYNVRGILLDLLGCLLGTLADRRMLNDELTVRLHQSLSGRRYLIVFDDMWNTKAWDDTRRYFPDYGNGSRIIVTTRESSVADYVGSSSSSHHQMNLLNKDDSWSLLRETVFQQETYNNCPPAFEAIGRRIANYCGGLPLAINVIGGLLSQSTGSTQLDTWMRVEAHIISSPAVLVANEDDQFSKILSLSYNNLPNHLKPCFLYMGAFLEDREIRATKLIRLWTAEGFLKPIPDKSLEEAAEMYLKDLVDRNLILVRQKETNGVVKSYIIHDLLRDLCVRKASQEKFLYIKNWKVQSLPSDDNILSLRRVSVHSSYNLRDVFDSSILMTLCRTFLCLGPASRKNLSPIFLGLRLLRVLDVLEIEFHEFPEEMLQLVNLRYLAFTCHSKLPSSISVLLNLQTLIFRKTKKFGAVILECMVGSGTYEIFHIPGLRYIKFIETYPTFGRVLRKEVIHRENVQTISGITVDIYFKDIIKSFPNLKKLGLYFFYIGTHDKDLTHLKKLETLKCHCHSTFWSRCFLPSINFPHSLKKLTLRDCQISSEYMNTIGCLPNLQVLKLRYIFFESPIWEPIEGEFSQLQVLLLKNLNLVNWVADESHFPRLQHLFIRYCDELEEIPIGIGEISTLEIIEVQKCSPSATASARKIEEEQHEMGNDSLQLRIYD